jgi:4-methylaminobutanoate oxidase (formaldehyde-forming)
VAVRRNLAWLARHRREGERVDFFDVTEELAVLALMGPDASRILAALGASDICAIGYYRHAESDVAGVRVRAARLSFVGEPGWELTCAADEATRLYDSLAGLGAVPAGLYAQESMRIEKQFLAMGRELDADVTPVEARLLATVKTSPAFIGQEAVERRLEISRSRIATIILDDLEADLVGDEPVYAAGELIGQVTSAAFGHRVGRNVALAYLATDLLPRRVAGKVDLDCAGKLCSGTVLGHAAFDPSGSRMRQP